MKSLAETDDATFEKMLDMNIARRTVCCRERWIRPQIAVSTQHVAVGSAGAAIPVYGKQV